MASRWLKTYVVYKYSNNPNNEHHFGPNNTRKRPESSAEMEQINERTKNYDTSSGGSGCSSFSWFYN